MTEVTEIISGVLGHLQDTRQTAQDILDALKKGGYVIERDWSPIEDAPKTPQPIMCINVKSALFDLHRWGEGQCRGMDNIRAQEIQKHARQDVPALVAEVRRLREALVEIAGLPLEEPDEGDEYGFSACMTEGHNDGVSKCQDIARQALEGGE